MSGRIACEAQPHTHTSTHTLQHHNYVLCSFDIRNIGAALVPLHKNPKIPTSECCWGACPNSPAGTCLHGTSPILEVSHHRIGGVGGFECTRNAAHGIKQHSWFKPLWFKGRRSRHTSDKTAATEASATKSCVLLLLFSRRPSHLPSHLPTEAESPKPCSCSSDD